MIEKSANFASYSKALCWIVALISLILAIITFTGGAETAMIRGLLWLGLAIAFAVSAIFLGRRKKTEIPPARGSTEHEV